MKTVNLWEGRAPTARGEAPADIPTLNFVREPDPGARRPTIIVCPGGGYGTLAPHEAEPIAEWLESLGICGIVLRYRLGPSYRHPIQLDDAIRAIRSCRAHSNEWGIDPRRLGILGFSAGGHLVSTVCTHWESGITDSEDPVDSESSRPDLSILVYPVIRMSSPYGHAGSRLSLLGDNPLPQLVESLDNDLQITKDTPPTLLIHGADDEVVPVQNSLLYAKALADAKVPFTLRILDHGPHGFGLGAHGSQQDWRETAELWLRGNGF